MQGENNHLSDQDKDHHDKKYDDPEYFFDFLVINHVGKDEFFKWAESIDEEERTMKNFKKHFKLNDKDLEKIMNTPISPEQEEEILKAPK